MVFLLGRRRYVAKCQARAKFGKTVRKAASGYGSLGEVRSSHRIAKRSAQFTDSVSTANMWHFGRCNIWSLFEYVINGRRTRCSPGVHEPSRQPQPSYRVTRSVCSSTDHTLVYQRRSYCSSSPIWDPGTEWLTMLNPGRAGATE